MSCGIGSPAHRQVPAAMLQSPDGPGGHQRGPPKTNLAISGDPQPRPTLQTEKMNLSDEESGELEAKGNQQTPPLAANLSMADVNIAGDTDA